MEHKSIIYIATDRAWAGTFKSYGGYNIYPNIDFMAEHGTLYENAIAAAGSTLMCHSAEWTGKYTWDLQNGTPYKKRTYQVPIPRQDSIFFQMEKRGYETHIVMVRKNPRKCFATFSPVKGLWTSNTKIHLIPDWDVSKNTTTRLTQIKKAFSCIEESAKKNKPAFIWVKCHGLNEFNQRMKYLNYAGQKRIVLDDLYNAEIDESIGFLLKEMGYPNNRDFEVIFASDHGSFNGQYGRYFYGYYLDQEIVHVPFISSEGNGSPFSMPFSMKNVKNMLLNKKFIPNDTYIYAETLYPGQVAESPNKNILSMPKIMVRRGKYKYIYSLYGDDGRSSSPKESLFDLDYDPHEKINLVPVLKGEPFRDITKGNLNGKKMTEVFTRLHSDVAVIKSNTIPERYLKNRFRPGSYVGWVEAYDVWSELQAKARDVWYKTGREKYFKV